MYKLKNMKAMYKSELAAYAGVSTGTLRRWLMPYRQQLNETKRPVVKSESS